MPPLPALIAQLNSDAAADAVVEKILDTVYQFPQGEDWYLKTFFDQDVRTGVFNGGSIHGRSVSLSEKARLLKSALQRRHVASAGTKFTPHRAYHITSSVHIAALIAKTGFIATPGTVFGRGAYFYGTSQAAEAYEARQILAPDGQPFPPIIVEVTIFSRLALNDSPRGSDEVTFYREPMDCYVVKNPLVIFPTAVFHRGEKFANTRDVLVDL